MIDEPNHKIRGRGSRWVYLTPRLWQLFRLLYAARGEVVPHRRTLCHLWPAQLPESDSALRTQIGALRKKIAGSGWRIVTYQGYGYALEESRSRRRNPPA